MRLVSFVYSGSTVLLLPKYNISSDVINFKSKLGVADVSNGFVVDTLSGAKPSVVTFTHRGTYKFTSESEMDTQVAAIEDARDQSGALARGIETYKTGTFVTAQDINATLTGCKATMTIQERTRRSDLYVLTCTFTFTPTDANWG